MRSKVIRVLCLLMIIVPAIALARYTLVMADNESKTSVTKTFKMIDGWAAIEAESVEPLNETGIIQTDATASAGKMVAFPAGDIVTDALSKKPILSYTFSTEKKMAITVWARTIAPTSSNDSFWVSIDNYEYKNVTLKKSNSWEWSPLLNNIEINAGLHTVNIIPREKANKIDKLVLTNDNFFTPSGDGSSPDEAIPAAVYNMPSIKPAAGHPRLFFTSKDIPQIRANMQKPQSAGAVNKMKELLSYPTDGSLNPPTNLSKGNFDAKILGAIEVWAFASALNKDPVLAGKAVRAMRKFLETIQFKSGDYDNQGQTVYTIAAVYDWGYDSLSAGDKKFFAQSVRRIANRMEIGWPPSRQNAVNGHGAEGQIMRDLLSAGIAMFDEYPDIYQNAAGRFFKEYINPRKYWYAAHTFHQGPHYTAYRYQWEMLAIKLAEGLGVKQVFGPDAQYLLYRMLYARRPDGKVLAEGDVHSKPANCYDTEYMRAFMLAGNYFKDPYLKQEALRELPLLTGFTPTGNQSLNVPEFLIFNDPDLVGGSFAELPLTKYFGTPSGAMIARTSWAEGREAPTALAEFRINEVHFMNHQHLDAGNFQMYYKGILATDSGYYQSAVNNENDKTNSGNTAYASLHDYNYNKRSIAHNVMLVYDPKEKWTLRNMQNANDGGQKWLPENIDISAFKDEQPQIPAEFKIGKVLGREFGPSATEPDYSYLKGDISKAYSSKVAGYERSFMFLNFKNNRNPAALIVFDRIESSDPNFKKTWLLHGLEEPQILNNQTVFRNERNGNNGKLTCDTLLPDLKNTSIVKVGGPGKEALVDGTDYFAKVDPTYEPEGGGWRIEVSPKIPQKQDFFLNVLQVGDSRPDVPPLKPNLIETETVVGVELADRVVVFGKQRNRIEQPVEFVVKSSNKNEITVCDLKAGTWRIEKNGMIDSEAIVTEAGGVALFDGGPGKYRLTYQNSNAVRKPAQLVEKRPDLSNHVSVVIDKMFVYSETPAFIRNEAVYAPIKVISEKLGAEFKDDQATKTVTVAKEGTVIKFTEGSRTVYLNATPRQLAAPVIITNGVLMAPVGFVAEALGATMEWDQFARIAYITTNKVAARPQKEGVATIVNCQWSSQDVDCPGTNSYDGDVTTRWAADGTAEWIVYAFDMEYEIDSVFFNFYKGSTRKTFFELQASNDGINYTTIIANGVSNGISDQMTFQLPKPVKAKFIRFIGKGNDTTNWNSINEVEFRTAK
jgi:hypothetical protein